LVADRQKRARNLSAQQTGTTKRNNLTTYRDASQHTNNNHTLANPRPHNNSRQCRDGTQQSATHSARATTQHNTAPSQTTLAPQPDPKFGERRTHRNPPAHNKSKCTTHNDASTRNASIPRKRRTSRILGERGAKTPQQSAPGKNSKPHDTMLHGSRLPGKRRTPTRNHSHRPITKPLRHKPANSGRVMGLGMDRSIHVAAQTHWTTRSSSGHRCRVHELHLTRG
jgi:hypothetical protein